MAKSTSTPNEECNVPSLMKPIIQRQVTISGWVLTELTAPGFINMKGVKDASGRIVLNCGIEANTLEDLSRKLESQYRFKFVDDVVCNL